MVEEVSALKDPKEVLTWKDIQINYPEIEEPITERDLT